MKSGWRTIGGIGAVAVLALAAGAPPAVPAPSPRSLPAVESIARQVSDGNVRGAVAALRARFRLDTGEGLGALREFSLAVLRKGLEDEDNYERCYAANALAEQGDWSGAAVLEDAVASVDSGVRRAAIDGLGEIGRGQALLILRRIYQDSDAFGRLLVLQGLRGAGKPQAFDLLMEGVRDPDASVRLQAAENLGFSSNARAIPALRAMLSREDLRPLEKIIAAHALLRLGDESGVPVLLAALDGGPGAGRPAATLALGHSKEGRFIAVLIGLLEDPDPDVSIAAAAALTRHGRKDGLPRLRQALGDEDAITRRHVATLLDNVDYAVARGVVLAGLAASDVGVKLAAAQVVGVAGDARAVGALAGILRADESPIVRADVAWALGRMSSAKVIEPLVELVQEEAPAVRYTAADGLARTASRLIGAYEKGPQQGAGARVPARDESKGRRRKSS